MRAKYNTIINAGRLGKDLIRRVRAKENGLFYNTIIKDDDMAYGYGKDGKQYTTNAVFIDNIARFVWHVNPDGYFVTDNVTDEDGCPMRMDEYIYYGLLGYCVK